MIIRLFHIEFLRREKQNILYGQMIIGMKKHDWWDVAAGAVIGAGSAYIFTRPFAKKHNLSISPVAGDGHYGVYASMTF